MAAIAVLNRKLAEKFYRVHMQKLRERITAEETRFQVSNVADRHAFRLKFL